MFPLNIVRRCAKSVSNISEASSARTNAHKTITLTKRNTNALDALANAVDVLDLM